MKIDPVIVQEYMNFFSGSLHNYGEYTYKDISAEGKTEGTAKTITNKLITIGNYSSHLEGEKGLGIIPIKENNKCRFSAIDIDIYNIDYNVYIEAIERNNFPLVPFRSKSGGLHLYLFLKEEVNAKSVVDLMKRFSLLLAIDSLVRDHKQESVEIFPKQTKLLKDSVGNWINLPYYNCSETKQYIIKDNKPLSLTEAIVYMKEKKVTLTEANDFVKDLVYSDSPPCLQTLFLLNPFKNDMGRNNFLFSFGVYLKKKDEDFFEQNLQEVNQGLKKPLKEHEVDKTILSSLRKKDYIYKCKESPCVDYCNKKICRKREFGIGKNEGYFSSVECGQLLQFKTLHPYYEWEVRLQGQEEFKLLKFKSEDEIIKQDVFLKLCMRELYEIPSKLKQGEWFNKVNQALKEIKVIDVSMEDDTSPKVLLKSFISDFLTGRSLAETKEQILAKRVYFDEKYKEYLFRPQDLMEYLYVQKQFRYYQPQELHGLLREFKCRDIKIVTENRKQIRVKAFSKQELHTHEPVDIKPDFAKFTEEEF